MKNKIRMRMKRRKRSIMVVIKIIVARMTQRVEERGRGSR